MPTTTRSQSNGERGVPQAIREQLAFDIEAKGGIKAISDGVLADILNQDNRSHIYPPKKDQDARKQIKNLITNTWKKYSREEYFEKVKLEYKVPLHHSHSASAPTTNPTPPQPETTPPPQTKHNPFATHTTSNMNTSNFPNELGKRVVLGPIDGMYFVMLWSNSRLENEQILIGENGKSILQSSRIPQPRDPVHMLPHCAWAQEDNNYMTKALREFLNEAVPPFNPQQPNAEAWTDPKVVVTLPEEVIPEFYDINKNPAKIQDYHHADGFTSLSFFLKTVASTTKKQPTVGVFANTNKAHQQQCPNNNSYQQPNHQRNQHQQPCQQPPINKQNPHQMPTSQQHNHKQQQHPHNNMFPPQSHQYNQNHHQQQQYGGCPNVYFVQPKYNHNHASPFPSSVPQPKHTRPPVPSYVPSGPAKPSPADDGSAYMEETVDTREEMKAEMDQRFNQIGTEIDTKLSNLFKGLMNEITPQLNATNTHAEERAQALAQAKAAAEAQAQAQEKAQAAAQAQAQAEAQAQAAAAEAAAVQAQAQAQAKSHAEAVAQAQAEARAQAWEQAQAEVNAKAQEAVAQAQAQAWEQAQAEANAKAQEAVAQAQAEVRAQAWEQAQAEAQEAIAQAQAQAWEQAKAHYEAEAREQVENQAKLAVAAQARVNSSWSQAQAQAQAEAAAAQALFNFGQQNQQQQPEPPQQQQHRHIHASPPSGVSVHTVDSMSSIGLRSLADAVPNPVPSGFQF